MGWRESDLRRPEFAGGVPLLLPDGQAWWFYEPRPDAGRPGAWLWGGIAPEDADTLTHELYRALKRLTAATDAKERAVEVLTLAMLCLARNYEIDGGRFNAILSSGPITGGLWARLEAIAQTIETEAIYAAINLTAEAANG